MNGTDFTAHGLAAGALLASLLDTLVAKQVLSREEAKSVVVGAYQNIRPYGGQPAGIAANTLIGNLVGRFS